MASRQTRLPPERRSASGQRDAGGYGQREQPGIAQFVAAVRLSELREQIGKTQTELAQMLDMTRANISRIVHTETQPRRGRL